MAEKNTIEREWEEFAAHFPGMAKQQDELRTPAREETAAACWAEIERAVGPLGEGVEA